MTEDYSILVKVLFLLGGLGVFIWGIIDSSWIRMIGGFLALVLGFMLEVKE